MPNLDSVNLDSLFRQTANNQPEHPAIKSAHRPWITYRELDALIDSAAETLQREGAGIGTTVGVHFPNSIEHIAFIYAVWRLGGCVVPIPTELALAEKEEICRSIAIDFVISSNTGMLSFAAPFVRGNPFSLPNNSVAAPLNAAREHPAGFSKINAAFIRFSSGTTGTSKGVVLSHESIYDRVQAANEAMQLGPDDRVIWVLSMSYHFAVSIGAYLTYGAAIILPANNWARGILDALQQENGTFLYASPMHYAMLADAPDGSPLPGLRLAVSTASPLNAQIAKQFQTRYELPLSQALGVIEVGLPAVNVDFAATRPEGVGRVLSNYRLRLEDCGLGPDVGEILLSGKGMLDAYYDPWQVRDEILPDGWFHTGDVGELDSDGCLTIRGRTKDVINVAGMKVFPLEVETVLNAHPAVADACVFAERELRCGEVPHARVILKSTESSSPRELIDYCRSRLAAHKVPRELEIVATLDRTPSGKILHRQQTVRVNRALTRQLT